MSLKFRTLLSIIGLAALFVPSLALAEQITNTQPATKTVRTNRTVSMKGTVSSVAGTSFILTTKERGDQTVNTSSTTQFKKNGQAASFSDVLAQETVTVSGVWDSTANTIAASKVNITIRTLSVLGTVTSISGSTIMMAAKNSTSTVYSVDTTNAKLIRHYGAALTLADMQTGDMLRVTGQILGTNIAAKTVRDDSLQARYGTFVGTVSSLSGTSFVLVSKERGNQTINTSTSTVIRLADKKGSFSDLAVGETVTVSGVWDRTNTNVTANRITIKVNGINLTGMLNSISGTTLSVTTASSTVYSIDASKTRVTYKNGHKADLSLLQTGDQVRVQGKTIAGSTNITASFIMDLSKIFSHGTTTPVTASSTSDH